MTIEHITEDYEMWQRLAAMTPGVSNSNNLNCAVYETVQKHGREFQSVPWRSWRGRGFRRMKEGHCFYNAAMHAIEHDGIYYTEGLAFAGMLVVHHAWCVTEDGLVIDPTWREQEWRPGHDEWEYFGIPFTLDFMREQSFKQTYWGTFLELREFHDDFPTGGVADLTNPPKADKLKV